MPFLVPSLAPRRLRRFAAALGILHLSVSLGCDSGSTVDRGPEVAACSETPPDPDQVSPALAFGGQHSLSAGPTADQREDIERAFSTWKSNYLDCGCGDGRYVVRAGIDDNNLTVSEAHGYGMLILAYMAGFEPRARAYFDGMARFFVEHPASGSPHLMAWYQDHDCQSTSGTSSASDGDLDIAYALLLADRQWGSCGGVDYLGLARNVIAAIKARELNSTGEFVLLGDWARGGQHANSTRSSDFMPDHFRAFAQATGDDSWLRVRDSGYDLFQRLTGEYSAGVGLLPDFILDPGGDPRPAGPEFLEGPNDGAYWYNACRVPMRLGVDVLTSDEPRAKALLGTLDAWASQTTAGSATRFDIGYTLDGGAIRSYGDTPLAYAAPFGVGARAAGNSTFHDEIWRGVTRTGSQGYYGDSLRLLSMLAMGGAWWNPADHASATCSE